MRRISLSLSGLAAAGMFIGTACSAGQTPVPATPAPQQAAAISPLQSAKPAATAVSPIVVSAGPIQTAPPPTLASGLGAITAVVVDTRSGQPIRNVAVYVTRVDSQATTPPVLLTGPRTENGDVASNTDGGGRVVLNGIAPGKYVLAVYSAQGWVTAAIPNKSGAPTPFISVEPDRVAELGAVYAEP